MGEDSLQLRDIHLPDAISWWPPAPGWWGLLLLVILVVLLLRAYWEMKQRRAARVTALKSLEQLTATFSQDQNQHNLVCALSVLLRRICLSYYPRKQVAALNGEAWLTFLDTHLGGEKKHSAKNKPLAAFSKGPGRSLITAPYQAKIDIDAQALLRLCGDWINVLPPKGKQYDSI